MPKGALAKAEKTKRQMVRQQEKKAAIRAKYGPSGKPSPVVVKQIDSINHEVSTIEVVDQRVFVKARSVSDRLTQLAVLAGYRSYEAYLDSAHWKELRLKAMARDRHRCAKCGYQRRLEVHHQTYVRMGRENLSDVQTLCHRCHKQKHRF